MKRFSMLLLLFLAIAPASVQARTFADLQTDLAAAPYRVIRAAGDFHPLAALSVSMRNGMAAWDEFTLRVQDMLVIGWGRVALGAEEVRASADRGLVAFLGRFFAAPVPQAAVPAAIGAAAVPASGADEDPAPDASGDRWREEVERLFRSSP